jgi:hypothetical protein
MIRLLIILLCLSMPTIHAGTIDPGVSDHKYTEYAKDFHYIGKICGKDDKGVKYCASCVVISKRYFLTAAHVVENVVESKIVINDKEFCVEEIISHKDYSPDKFGLNDIAIGYVKEDIGLEYYPELYDKNDEVGKICSIAGYGLTGNFNTGAMKSDNKRRAGSNIIDGINKQLLICSPSKPLDKGRTELEFLIASGDSGGGLFIDGKLAGINSCVMTEKGSPRSDYRTESGHTRISQHIVWIKRNVRFFRD